MPASFCFYFRPFVITISKTQNEKSEMVCMGFEPGATGR